MLWIVQKKTFAKSRVKGCLNEIFNEQNQPDTIQQMFKIEYNEKPIKGFTTTIPVVEIHRNTP